LAKEKEYERRNAMSEEKQLKVIYEIDIFDIEEKDLKQAKKCGKELGAWFEAQSIKTQLAIYYAYTVEHFHGDNTLQHCPWWKLLKRARDDIFKKHMPKDKYNASDVVFELAPTQVLLDE
jgi:hypothetical protein